MIRRPGNLLAKRRLQHIRPTHFSCKISILFANVLKVAIWSPNLNVGSQVTVPEYLCKLIEMLICYCRLIELMVLPKSNLLDRRHAGGVAYPDSQQVVLNIFKYWIGE
jgi:hypothetical protein